MTQRTEERHARAEALLAHTFDGRTWTLALSCGHLARRRYVHEHWRPVKSTRCWACWKHRPVTPREHLTPHARSALGLEPAGVALRLGLGAGWRDPGQEPHD